MAKDKNFEREYRLERLRRTKVRKATRREKRQKYRAKYGHRCPCCGHVKDNDWDW